MIVARQKSHQMLRRCRPQKQVHGAPVRTFRCGWIDNSRRWDSLGCLGWWRFTLSFSVPEQCYPPRWSLLGPPCLLGFPCCGRLYHIRVGHDNPTGEKESKEQAHESEFHSFLQSGIPWKYQANSYNLNTEDLEQTHIGLTFVASISVSSYVPCFIGSEGLALLVSSILSGS